MSVSSCALCLGGGGTRITFNRIGGFCRILEQFDDIKKCIW